MSPFEKEVSRAQMKVENSYWIRHEMSENNLNGRLELFRRCWRWNGLDNSHVTKTWLPSQTFHCSLIVRSSNYPTCNPSISLTDSLSVQGLDSHQCSTFFPPPSFFLSLSSIPTPFFAFPYTQKKPNYNTAKPIWEQQASHSVGEGGWDAFCHQTSKLQHVKPRPTACPVQHLDHSSAMCVNLIIQGTLL